MVIDIIFLASEHHGGEVLLSSKHLIFASGCLMTHVTQGEMWATPFLVILSSQFISSKKWGTLNEICGSAHSFMCPASTLPPSSSRPATSTSMHSAKFKNRSRLHTERSQHEPCLNNVTYSCSSNYNGMETQPTSLLGCCIGGAGNKPK